MSRTTAGAAAAQKPEEVTIAAGFWIRVAALILDLTTFMIWSSAFRTYYSRFFPEVAFFGRINLTTVVMLGAFWAYLVVATKMAGGTLGKKLLRIEVLDANSGARVDWATAFFREVVGRTIVGATFFLGYLWAGIDRRKQGWHDKIADTVAVRRLRPVRF